MAELPPSPAASADDAIARSKLRGRSAPAEADDIPGDSIITDDNITNSNIAKNIITTNNNNITNSNSKKFAASMDSISPPPADFIPESEEDDQPRRKRQRVAAACDKCRTKKIKCDGRRPVCAPCSTQKRGPRALCTWGSRMRRSRGISMDESRRHQTVESANIASQYSAVAVGDDDDEARVVMKPAPRQSLRRSSSSEHNNHANAMMGLMDDEETQATVDHFGDSSATGFMHQIKRVIDGQMNPEPKSPAVSKGRLESSTYVKPSDKGRQGQLDYVLPPRYRADHLLDTYWRLVDTLYPFLDRTEVESLYRRLWAGELIGEDEPVFLSLLNIVFSIACALDAQIPPGERESSADIFYQRARELSDFEFVQRRSVMTVIYFLLLGQYLQSTNDPRQCWNVIGLAIRMAQSLGLDLPSTSAQAQSPQKREYLRKVWHGCVLMDRTLAITFGRPPMITAQGVAVVPSPIPHQDGSICPCSTTMRGLNSESAESHFFVESLKLYEIINEALLNLYNAPSEEQPKMDPYVEYFGSLGARGLGLLFDRDRALCLWHRSVPSHLRHTSNHSTHQRQANVLRFRYLHVRILLYRPVLSRFCSGYENEEITLEEAMPWKVALQCSLVCLNTALEVIELFDSIMEGRELEDLDVVLPAWWYSILYVYSAATVLIAARLHPSITALVPEQTIVKTWRVVMKIMGRIQKFSSHAKRFTAALNILFDQVPQQHRKNRGRLHQRDHSVATNQQQQQTPYSERSPFPSRTMEAAPANAVGPARSSIATQAQRPPTPSSVSTANLDRAATEAFEYDAQGEKGGASQLLFNSYPGSLLMDAPFNEGLFDTLELQLGHDDMSWLSSLPYH